MAYHPREARFGEDELILKPGAGMHGLEYGLQGFAEILKVIEFVGNRRGKREGLHGV
jgi:hypothetical protein